MIPYHSFALDADKGIGKLKKADQWLGSEYPSAASSLLEGLDEMFTINRLGLPKQLCRFLGSTNVIESSYSGVRQKTGRLIRWRDGQMVLRWTASKGAFYGEDSLGDEGKANRGQLGSHFFYN